MHRIGIIGYGVVGKAIQASYQYLNGHTITTIDPSINPNVSYETLSECDYVFVCVPSPQKEDGSCDTSILYDVLIKLQRINYKGVIISKVTAPPDTYKYLQSNFDNLVYVPEFLTTENAPEDYQSAKYHIIGSNNRAYSLLAKEALELSFGIETVCRFMSIEEAAMIKYAVNSFLATKVVWMNELKELCDKTNIDFLTVSTYMGFDKRIGASHMKVPGPDGQVGFGGKCFPKDTTAFLTYAQKNDILLSVLNTAIEKNKTYR